MPNGCAKDKKDLSVMVCFGYFKFTNPILIGLFLHGIGMIIISQVFISNRIKVLVRTVKKFKLKNGLGASFKMHE